MKRQDILERIKQQVLPILKKADVTKAALFGGLFDLVRLQRNLQEKLKKDIDVVTYRGISHHLKDSILRNQYALL